MDGRGGQNLADLLADEVGNLRPEVARLIMEAPRPQAVNRRPRVEAVERPAPRPRGHGFFFWMAIIIFILWLFSELISALPSGRRCANVQQQLYSQAQSIVQEPAPNPPHAVSAAVTDPYGTDGQPAVATSDPVPVERQVIGRVVGDNVNVRNAPGLSGEAIAAVNQGQELRVISLCANGWYRVLLADSQPGYIFGAYISPVNYRLCRHLIGIDRQGRRLLLIQSQDPDWYPVVLPAGGTVFVRKDDVRILE